MIQRSKYRFGFASCAVVERGKKIKRHERGTVDAEADYLPGIAKPRCMHNEHDKTCERKARPDQMCDTI
jgi:hypothetical protein